MSAWVDRDEVSEVDLLDAFTNLSALRIELRIMGGNYRVGEGGGFAGHDLGDIDVRYDKLRNYLLDILGADETLYPDPPGVDQYSGIRESQARSRTGIPRRVPVTWESPETESVKDELRAARAAARQRLMAGDYSGAEKLQMIIAKKMAEHDLSDSDF